MEMKIKEKIQPHCAVCEVASRKMIKFILILCLHRFFTLIVSRIEMNSSKIKVHTQKSSTNIQDIRKLLLFNSNVVSKLRRTILLNFFNC
jgi:ribosomal protein S17